ncbi:hypothetical protein M9434_002974 [Picochlorum sp. BPE23]|nr:hypothetical protein M9434_002974 [Picochlorum sp. BPE23]
MNGIYHWSESGFSLFLKGWTHHANVVEVIPRGAVTRGAHTFKAWQEAHWVPFGQSVEQAWPRVQSGPKKSMHVHRGGPMCAKLQVFNICRRESQACHLFAEDPAGGLGPAEPREAAVSDEICNPSMEVAPFDPCTYPLGCSNSADVCYVQFLVNDVGANGSLVLHSADRGQAESIVQDALYWRHVALLVCPDFCTIAAGGG